MARALAEVQVTQADELRGLLTDSEKRLAHVRSQGIELERLLLDLDCIQALWPVLVAGGMDLRAEATRWETIQALVHRHAGDITRELRQHEGWEARRARRRRDSAGAPAAAASESPEGSGDLSWWWHLDEEVRHRRLRQVRRLGAIAAAVVLVALAAALIINRLFPSDPKVSAAAGQLLAGQQKLETQQDFAGALADFQAATQTTPQRSGALGLAGSHRGAAGPVVRGQRGLRAGTGAGRPGSQHLLVAGIRLRCGPDDRPGARRFRCAPGGGSTERPGLLRAGHDPGESGGSWHKPISPSNGPRPWLRRRTQPQLVAMARYRLGMLMQRMQVVPSGSATPGR